MVMCVSLFFFFKQKTAYEMRISDWSSDVCSSDLNLLLTGEVSYRRKIREAILATRIEAALSKEQILELYLNEIPLGRRSFGVQAASREIGRASCRERVCQYV